MLGFSRLVVAIANYTSTINEKNKEIDSLKSQIIDKDSIILSLNSTVENLRMEVDSKNSQISSLRDERDQLQMWLKGNKTLLY